MSLCDITHAYCAMYALRVTCACDMSQSVSMCSYGPTMSHTHVSCTTCTRTYASYAFLSSLTLVFLSEFGDKTFIATVLMTMDYNTHRTTSHASHLRHGLVILLATNLACACIAIITSLLSYATLAWLQISPVYMTHVSTAACVIFGVQILWDTWMRQEESEETVTADKSAAATPDDTTSTETATSASVTRRLSLPLLHLPPHLLLVSHDRTR